jgi:hypothetical protein
MEDVADGRVGVVQYAMSHRLRGWSNQSEALNPVVLRVIPVDHAQVAKVDRWEPAGLGAGDEEGSRAADSREGRKAAAQVAEAHTAVTIGVATHESRAEEPVPPGNEGFGYGTVDLWIQGGYPMVCPEPDDTLFVQLVNFFHYPKIAVLTLDRGILDPHRRVGR